MQLILILVFLAFVAVCYALLRSLSLPTKQTTHSSPAFGSHREAANYAAELCLQCPEVEVTSILQHEESGEWFVHYTFTC